MINGDAVHTLSVNTGTGNLVTSVTDFVIPGRVPFVFMRTYNSGNSAVSGLLGKGWHLSFEERLSSPVYEADITYIDTTGAEWVWAWNQQEGRYDPPDGMFSSLELDGGSGSYILTMLNGFKRYFDGTSGLLQKYEDPNGNALLFSWTNGQLTSVGEENVSHSSVLISEFTYSASGLLEELTYGSDQQNEYHWVFGYDQGTSTLLETVTNPLGDYWKYEYTFDILTHIYDPNVSADPSPAYNTGITYTAGQVTALTDADGQSIDFDYVEDTNEQTITTTITDREEHDTVNVHLVDSDYALSTITYSYTPWNGTSPTSHTATYTWDSLLRLDSYTDFNGHATTYTYWGIADGADKETDCIKKLTNACSEETEFTYNANFTLHTSETPMEFTTTYHYEDPYNPYNLTGISRPLDDPGTPATTFAYNEFGDLIESVDPSGQRKLFTYNATRGSLENESRVLDVGGASKRLTVSYTYDADYLWVLTTTSEYDVISEVTRDKLGRVEQFKTYNAGDPDNTLTIDYTFDKSGNLLSYNSPQYPDGYTLFTYHRQGWLATVKYPVPEGELDPPEFDRVYVYDKEGNLETDTAYLNSTYGLVTTYAYDEASRLITTILPPITGEEDRSEYHIEYDPVGNVTKRIDALENAVEYAYDDVNRLTGQTGPLPDQAFEYRYDADSRLTDMIGQPNNLPAGYASRTYSYTYDENGRLTGLQDPKLYVVKYEYYANNQLKSVSGPIDLETQYPTRTYLYDSVGRVVQVTDATGASTHYSYRADDLLETSTTADGHTTRYTYDGFGRISRIDFPAASYTEYQYDANSNITKITGPDGFSVGYEYDERDRLINITRVDLSVQPTPPDFTTTYTYDNLNRLIAATDPRDSQVQYGYDAHSRLTSKIIDANYGQIIDGFEYTFAYTYDLNGRLETETTPEPSTITREYNEAGQVVSIKVAAGSDEWTTTFTYDLWGMLTEQTNPDGTKEYYSYDDLGRLTRQENFLGEYYTYGYDARGNNTSLAAPFGALTQFTYNLRDELTMTSTSDSSTGSQPVIENFWYTPTGKLDTYGGPGNEFWYMKYDELGRWTSATTSVGTSAERTYNKSNTLAASRDLQGPWYSMEYNGLRQRTKTIHTADSTTIAEYTWNWLDLEGVLELEDGTGHTFTYDRLGRITGHTETLDGTPQTTAYTYNWRGQVLTCDIDGTEAEEAYTYDGRGLCTGIDYGSAASKVTFTYDAMGRALATTYGGQATRRYYYNVIGRMIGDAIQDTSGTIYATYYSYDMAGNRVTQVLDRKRTVEGSALPGAIPTDDYGNPVIHDGAGVDMGSSGGYDITHYPAYSAGYENLTIEIQDLQGEPEPEQPIQIVNIFEAGTTNPRGDWYEVVLDPITGEPIFIWHQGDWCHEEPLTGDWRATPPEWSENCTIADDTRELDFLGRVTGEELKDSQFTEPTGVSPFTDPDCPNLKKVSTGGSSVAASAAGRAGVKNSVTFDKDLLNGGIGAVNQLGEPWASLLDPYGDQQQRIEIAYYDNGTREIIAGLGNKLREVNDQLTGNISEITRINGEQETAVYNAGYDAFGRLRRSHYNLAPEYDREYRRDWRTGDVNREHDQVDDVSWWHHHYPGHSHTMPLPASPPEYLPEWELRGPQGQVKWRLDEGGNVTDFYGYGSWGNRISAQSAAGTGTPASSTRYLDGDLLAAPAMPQFKTDGGTAQDMTPQLGAQTGAPESGAAGSGGGNPDTGPGGNASFLQNDGGWSIGEPGGPQTGPARPGPAFTPEELGLSPISESHLPGYGTSKAPQFAPPAAVDQAGIADQRLKGMFGAQRFHGPAPGKQTGSLGCDDYRNPRLPLPAKPGAGFSTGPSGFGNGGWSIGAPGGHQTGPALIPRGLDPQLLGLPAGGGGAPLLDNPGDGRNRQLNPGEVLIPASANGVFTASSDGSSGGGGNGNAQVPENAPADEFELPGILGYGKWWLDTQVEGVNWLYDHTLGWVSGQIVGAVGKTQWGAAALEWTGGAAVTAQNYIDEQGAQVFGTSQWNNFRSVMNFDNKYVQAASNTFDFATLIFGAVGAVKSVGGAGLKSGLGAALKAGVRETAEEAVERGVVLAVKEELGLSAFNRAARKLPAEALGDVYVYLGYEPGNPNPTYVGITNNLERRAIEHAGKYRITPLTEQGLNRQYARGIEQVIIERNRAKLPPELRFNNKNNSISPKNPIYNDMKTFAEWYLNK